MAMIEDGGEKSLFATETLIRRFIQFRDKSSLDILDDEIANAVEDIESALADVVTVDELLSLAAELCASRTTMNPDFALLAGNIEAFRLKRNIPLSFSANYVRLRANVGRSGRPHPLVSEATTSYVTQNAAALDALVSESRDYTLSYFGMRTLAKAYLLLIEGLVAETPQYLFLRVAVGIHGIFETDSSMERIVQTYELMSSRYFIHSSPTLFNAGTENNYLSLCFLMGMEEDSIDGIYKTLHKAALILKGSGGLGIHVHNIRALGALIASSNGVSSGLVPMLRVFNNTARYVDQGGNKRPGAFAIYLEPWHADVAEVLELRKNHGKEELRARDLFYALWIPDLFMQRVKDNGDWSLFSPDEAPGLSDVHGQKFNELYEKYERMGLYRQKIKARKLWMSIMESQTETGMPFMLYKDSCNAKLNQQNLGTIKSSNLCCEIVEYSSPEETAVCNLASLALPSFVKTDHDNVEYDFATLHEITKVVVRNLDMVIDVTNYPIESSRTSNLRHRPIAVGVQGLADTFIKLRLPFDSPEAKTLNEQIFETIYHAAVECSVELAVEKGKYLTFEGSPASNGLLQFDLWNEKPQFFDDWDELKKRVKSFGLRNSLLVAPMPTASTSQILGFNECFEPMTSNIYSRRVLSGEFQVVNHYLVHDLKKLGIWCEALKNKIIQDSGLIQNIKVIPADLKALYKTVWEISQKVIIQMAADRGKFVDQLQSMNIHLQDPTFRALTSCHFYAWERGLKTGMYYLRTQAASRAIQFTVESDKVEQELSQISKPKNLVWPHYVEASGKLRRRPEDMPREHIKRHHSNTPLTNDSQFNSSIENADSQTQESEEIDIHNSTPILCTIERVEGNCDVCSG